MEENNTPESGEGEITPSLPLTPVTTAKRYVNKVTGEVRYIEDEEWAAWEEANDPQLEEWEELPPEPEPEPVPPPPPSFVRPYINKVTGEVRDLDDLIIYGWTIAGNPKADNWEPYTAPEPPAPPPVADWERFEDLALDSDSLKEIFPRIGEINPVASAMLGASLLKAKGGDTTDFLRVWKKILTDLANNNIPVPTETLEGFVAVAKACNLPEAFVYALQGMVPPPSRFPPIVIEPDSATFGEGVVESDSDVDVDSATYNEGVQTESDGGVV